MTELNTNDVNFISINRQKLDLLKDVYLWYRRLYICRDTTQFYEYKKCPSKKPAMVLAKFELMSFLFGENKYVMCTVPCLYKLEYNISGHDAAADDDDEVQCSTLITLCLVSIGMDHHISEQCYKGTILQRIYL